MTSRQPSHVAFAYQHQGAFVTADCWGANPGLCQTTEFEFPGTRLYNAADTDEYSGEAC